MPETDEVLWAWSDELQAWVEKPGYRKYRLDLQNTLREFQLEVEKEDPAFIKDCRQRYLVQEMENLKQDILEAYKRYKARSEQGIDYVSNQICLLTAGVGDKEIRLKALYRELKSLSTGDPNGQRIAAEDIIRARERPFAEVIGVKRFPAACPFHADRRPSFSVKNNRGRCFSCSWSGDVIKFLMTRDNLSFREAVRCLSQKG